MKKTNFKIFPSPRLENSRCPRCKTFPPVIYEVLYYSRMFVPRRPFQPSLIFGGKAGASLSVSTFQVVNSIPGFWPYSQTLD